MTLDKARELLKVQAGFGGSSNSAKLIMSEVAREHGRAVVDQLVRELELEKVLAFNRAHVFEEGLAKKPRMTTTDPVMTKNHS